MPRGIVKYNGRIAGFIEKKDNGYHFTYDDRYFTDPKAPAVSLTIPKTEQKHHSSELFPFFFGLLAEGIHKDLQCRLLSIDENDHYTRLLKTAHSETIGAITVEEEQNEV